MARSEKNATLDAVFEQECSTYLRSLGVHCIDGHGINAPYRPGADSTSFHTNGVFFTDYSHGIRGNVWQLALLMNNDDRGKAMESLCRSAGVVLDSISTGHAKRHIATQEMAETALEKVRDAFPISKAPEEVRKYVTGRMITDATAPFLSYIPLGQLASVLSEEEAKQTGLDHREGLIILWYLVGGRPKYYCTRAIDTKEFKKAQTDRLRHPIWNYDDLYQCSSVVWGEGMFDVLSLKALGYGVAGEITCWPIAEHGQALVKALWWRAKHHPDWDFIICLDNDQETKDGKRPGNEAAEQLARRLFAEGLDVKWVRHEPGTQKVDINQLHQDGKTDYIHRMMQSAKLLSEIFPQNQTLSALNFSICMNQGDYNGAQRFLKVLNKEESLSLKEIAETFLQIRLPWDHYYDGILDMGMWEDTVYVVLPAALDGKTGTRSEAFKKANVLDNLRGFQRNQALRLKWDMLDIPSRRPYFRVKRETTTEDEHMFNLFRAAPLLNTEPIEGLPDLLPPQWEILVSNLAPPAEAEWLLNHMATYFQTLNKPRTIPVCVGPQGNGKNTIFELFGQAIGGYIAVGNDILETSFNDWLLNPVILLDEFVTDSNESRKLKSKLKGLINHAQSINRKYERVFPCEINNYIAMSSNEYVVCSPVIVEDGDRRYSIIFNPASKNLAHMPGFDHDQLVRELPDFIRYLMSRGIDEHKANTPLENRQKEIMMDMTEDERVAVVKDWIAAHKGEDEITQSEICRQVNDSPLLKRPISTRKMRPIMEKLGHMAYNKNGQLWYRGFATVVADPWCDTAGVSSEAETNATKTPNTPVKPLTDVTPGGETVAKRSKPTDGLDGTGLF
jgi:hypothetical protein